MRASNFLSAMRDFGWTVLSIFSQRMREVDTTEVSEFFFSGLLELRFFGVEVENSKSPDASNQEPISGRILIEKEYSLWYPSFTSNLSLTRGDRSLHRSRISRHGIMKMEPLNSGRNTWLSTHVSGFGKWICWWDEDEWDLLLYCRHYHVSHLTSSFFTFY